MRIAAPTDSSPAGSAVTASRLSVWSANPGSGKPAAFHASPASEDTSSGWVAELVEEAALAVEASIATARKFTSGIITPSRSAASATPGMP